MEQAGKTKRWPAARALAPWLLPAAVYALVWLVFGVRYEVNDDATLAHICWPRRVAECTLATACLPGTDFCPSG